MARTDPERLARLTNRAAGLKPLVESEAWAELRLLVAERKEAHFRSMTTRLMNGTLIPDAEVHRTAGFFKGMETLLDYPELSQAQLRRALERAEREEREASESA
jgi:hypothetical protein